MHCRNAVTAALLAGGDRDLLPVRLPPGGALALGPRDRPGGQQGPDLRDPELDRLANGEFHALAGRDALNQNDMKRGFALDGAMLEQIDAYLQPLDRRNAARVLAAAAVEQGDVIAGPQADDVDRVMRRILGDRAGAACAQGGVDKKPRRLSAVFLQDTDALVGGLTPPPLTR